MEHLPKTIDRPLDEVLDSPFVQKYLNELDPETQKKILSVEIYNQRKKLWNGN